MGAIYKRELKSYLCSMTGCVMIAVILALVGFFTTYANIGMGEARFEISLILAVNFYIFVITVPFITMRSIAEERHSKTEQLLLSLPISTTKIVLAKYLAMMTIVGIPLLITAAYPILLTLFSSVEGAMNLATAYNAWFMLVLMLAAMVAMGMFASSLVESQVIAAVISVGAFLLLYFMSYVKLEFPTGALASLIAVIVLAAALGAIVIALTKNSTVGCIVTGVISVASLAVYLIKSSLFAGLFPKLISGLAFFDAYTNGGAFMGAFDIGEVVYYISFAVVFIVLTVQSVERRRYS